MRYYYEVVAQSQILFDEGEEIFGRSISKASASRQFEKAKVVYQKELSENYVCRDHKEICFLVIKRYHIGKGGFISSRSKIILKVTLKA